MKGQGEVIVKGAKIVAALERFRRPCPSPGCRSSSDTRSGKLGSN